VGMAMGRRTCLLTAAILAGGVALAEGSSVRIRRRQRPSIQSSTRPPVRTFLEV
jgi:hypothetical protein